MQDNTVMKGLHCNKLRILSTATLSTIIFTFMHCTKSGIDIHVALLEWSTVPVCSVMLSFNHLHESLKV